MSHKTSGYDDLINCLLVKNEHLEGGCWHKVAAVINVKSIDYLKSLLRTISLIMWKVS